MKFLKWYTNIINSNTGGALVSDELLCALRTAEHIYIVIIGLHGSPVLGRIRSYVDRILGSPW